MPPKRKQAASAATTKAPAKRRSKLAKEHDINAEEELEIQEAWAIFSQEDEDHKEGILATSDVRRCLVALNAPPKDSEELSELVETVDPDETGWVEYERFYAIAALKLNARNDDPDAVHEEVNKAYHLFTKGQEREISVQDLKRVAKELKEDIPDSVLRDMIREAKGGELGTVSLDDFADVMRRAGVFG